VEYLVASFADHILRGPPKGFGHGPVRPDDPEFAVMNGDPILDGIKSGSPFFGRLFQLLFHRVDVEGHLDGSAKPPFLEGLQKIPERPGDLGPLKGPFVGVGGEEDHRYFQPGPDLFGRRHPIHIPPEDDVHQDQVRPSLQSFADRLLSGRGRPGDGVSHALQGVLQILGDDSLVFRHQYLGFIHRLPLRLISDFSFSLFRTPLAL
jgi:hypothetical protein